MSLSASMQISDQDIYSTSLAQGGESLGQVGQTADGRMFKYSKSGAVALAPGLLTNPTAIVANSVTRTLGAGNTYATGSQQFTFTLGATAVTQDQYAGGYLVVTDGTGKGQTLVVVGNTAATAGNSYSITVKTGDAVNVALDATSVVGLYPNLNANVVLAAASATVPVTGVPVVNIPAVSFYWSQVGGYASVLSAGAITKNAGAIVSAAVQGAATIELAATVTQRVGYAPELTVDTKYSPLVLNIAS